MNCPHCDTHIDEHEATRCLDAWVAEVVMELEVRVAQDAVGDFLPLIPSHDGISLSEGYYAGGEGKLEILVPDYSKVIYAAWMVHQKACSWLFSKRKDYLRQLRHSVSRRLLPLYPSRTIAWPDVMLRLEPVGFCRAAIKVTLND